MNESIPPHGGKSNPWWDNSAEQRLNFINDRLMEVRNALLEVTKELRSQTRTSDIHENVLNRVNERLKECEREIEILGTKFDRFASIEWMQRLDLRVANIEDEGRSPFVRKSEYEFLKRSAYSILGVLCAGLIGAVLKLIFK